MKKKRKSEQEVFADAEHVLAVVDVSETGDHSWLDPLRNETDNLRKRIESREEVIATLARLTADIKDQALVVAERTVDALRGVEAVFGRDSTELAAATGVPVGERTKARLAK